MSVESFRPAPATAPEALPSSARRLLVPGAPSADLPEAWKGLAALLPAVFAVLVVAVALGAWLSLARTRGGSPQAWIGTWLAMVVPLALWLLAVSRLARTRFYQARPTLPLGVLLLPAIGLFLLTRLPDLPELLSATPRSWLIGVQVVRLVGGVFLLVWLSREVRQPWFDVEAGSLDLIVGASALPVAWWVASGSPIGLLAGVVWNLVGLLDFVLAIVISTTIRGAGASSYLFSLNTPVVAAFRPTILGILAFAVPLVIMVHALSLWQLLAA